MRSSGFKREVSRALFVFHFIGLSLTIGTRFAAHAVEQQTSTGSLQTLALGRDLAGGMARSLALPGILLLLVTGIAMTVLRYGRRPPVWVLIKVGLSAAALALAYVQVVPALTSARAAAHWSAEHGQMSLQYQQSLAQAGFYGAIVLGLFLFTIVVAVWKPFSSPGKPRSLAPTAATMAAAIILAVPHAAQAAGPDYGKTDILTSQLAPHLYALTGSAGTDPGHPEAAGGRILVLAGPDGVLMVDAQYAPLADKVTAAIRKIDAGPIRFLIDTHEHPDHTGGNPAFARHGAVIVAREETREALTLPLPPALAAAIGNAASFTDPARLPVLTFGAGSSLKIRLDGETVDVIALPAAHTDGDVIVRFETANIIAIGDFYRNYGYPFVDPSHGGSFDGVLAALDFVAALAGPDTRLVPGHGGIVGKADLLAYRAMIENIRAEVRRLAGEGKSLPQILAADVTSPYDAQVRGGRDPLPIGQGTSADRFVATLYAEVAR